MSPAAGAEASAIAVETIRHYLEDHDSGEYRGFGAGGDRDRGKRAPMGYAVGELADVQIVTSDNPRSEDPATIAEAVAEGVRAAGGRPRIVLDRREAIAAALERADEKSLVLIAGKGHEAYQTIGDTRIPFSDQEVVRSEARRARCA